MLRAGSAKRALARLTVPLTNAQAAPARALLHDAGVQRSVKTHRKTTFGKSQVRFVLSIDFNQDFLLSDIKLTSSRYEPAPRCSWPAAPSTQLRLEQRK